MSWDRKEGGGGVYFNKIWKICKFFCGEILRFSSSSLEYQSFLLHSCVLVLIVLSLWFFSLLVILIFYFNAKAHHVHYFIAGLLFLQYCFLALIKFAAATIADIDCFPMDQENPFKGMSTLYYTHGECDSGVSRAFSLIYLGHLYVSFLHMLAPNKKTISTNHTNKNSL